MLVFVIRLCLLISANFIYNSLRLIHFGDVSGTRNGNERRFNAILYGIRNPLRSPTSPRQLRDLSVTYIRKKFLTSFQGKKGNSMIFLSSSHWRRMRGKFWTLCWPTFSKTGETGDKHNIPRTLYPYQTIRRSPSNVGLFLIAVQHWVSLDELKPIKSKSKVKLFL